MPRAADSIAETTVARPSVNNPDCPSLGQESPLLETLWQPPGPVDAIIEQAHQAFSRDLPRLLKERPGEWVAYHGAECIGIGPSKTQLYQVSVAKGYGLGQFIVLAIEPETSEEIDAVAVLDV